jgi:hypothetical protein
LLALLNDHLVQLSDHLQILNDIGVLVRDQHQEELLHGQIHIADAVRLNMRALLSYNKLLIIASYRAYPSQSVWGS